MGYGHRMFVFGDDGSLRRVPEQLSAGLAVGQIRLPEFANQTWRVASVLLSTEDGKPIDVLKVTGSLWHFDARGGIQRSLAKAGMQALEMYESERDAVASNGPVVDISGQIARRRWEQENRWEPPPADITRMINAIWPRVAGRPVEPLRTIATSWKRRKPVSRDAEYVVEGCRPHVYEIRRRLRDLSERDLEGVMTKLNEDGADDVIDACLWGGVAEACKQEIERRKAWRRNKGPWYAVAERVEWQGHERSFGPARPIEHVATDSKDAAERAARNLIRKYADHFSERSEVIVKIHPAIEWQPPEE